MIEKIKAAANRFSQIEEMLALPETASKREQYLALLKEHKRLEPLVAKFLEYEKAETLMTEAEEILKTESDAELRALAEEEYYLHKEELLKKEAELRVLLIPKDPNADRNVIMELRAGAGGEEAALFAADLFRMYMMYAASCHFKTEVLSENATELGGYREITFRMTGEGAYDKMRFESGVQRVQRIPVTESNGKLQTSTVTVAVLPEAEAVEVEINPSDITVETIKSSGAGGQHINKTESAVRLIHKPSGIVIEARNERSQMQNREQAMRLLRTKLYDQKQQEADAKIANARRSQIGSGDRSEKIRTYNFPQGRVTDHRIGLTLYSLGNFLNGDMEAMIETLASADAAEKLKDEQI